MTSSMTSPSHNNNATESLHALGDTNTQMAEKEMGISDTFLHARIVRALPDEYVHVKATLQTIKDRNRAEIIRMVDTRYSTLPQKDGSQWSSQPPKQAFISSESGGRSGARRGRGRGRGGTQGRGRGGSSSKGGCRSSASSASGSSHGGGSRPPGRCWRCNRRDRIRKECTTKESDSIAESARCSGSGHEESRCSSDAAVLWLTGRESAERENNSPVHPAITRWNWLSLWIGEVNFEQAAAPGCDDV